MKPSDRCAGTQQRAGHYNVIWWYFQDILADVFTDIDPMSIRAKEVNPYVATNQPAVELFPVQCQHEIEALRKAGYAIGDNEKELFDFLFCRSFNSPLYIVGDPGGGKTMALANFRKVLSATSLGKKSMVISVDANDYAERLRNADDPLTVKSMLCDEIASAVKHFHQSDEFVEQLWEFIGARLRCFSQVANYIRDFMSSVQNKTKGREFMAQERVVFAKTSPFQYYYAQLLFLHLERGMNVQLVVDNIDVLPTEMQLDAAVLLRNIAKADSDLFTTYREEKRSLALSGLKCIIAIRPAGLRNIPKVVRARQDLIMYISQPALSDILARRISYFLAQKQTKKKLAILKQTPLRHRGRTYRYSDVEETLNCMHQTLLSPDALEVLSLLSRDDIRAAIALSGRFFRSHTIPDKYLAPTLFSQYFDTYLPRHIFIRALILTDRLCYEEASPEHSFMDVVNVFRAFGQEEVGSLFAPVRILGFLASHSTSRKPIPRLMLDGVAAVYPDLDKKEMEELLATWLHYGLITSPDASVACDIQDVKRIAISKTGRYYFNHLGNCFSYLQCIKDDCDVRETDIDPMCRTEGIEETATATVEFCAWLLSEEERERNRIRAASEEVRAHFRELAKRRPCVMRPLLSKLARELFGLARSDKRIRPIAQQAEALARQARELQESFETF